MAEFIEILQDIRDVKYPDIVEKHSQMTSLEGLAEDAQAGAQDAYSNAVDAKVSAESAKSAAQAAQSGAESARDYAQEAQSDAESAKLAAQGAQSGAESAKTAAQTAQSSAEGALNDTNIALTATTNARNDAITAKNSAEFAQNGAESAQVSAESAKTAAQTAQSGAEDARDISLSARDAAQLAESNAQDAKAVAQNASTTSLSIKTNVEALEASVASKAAQVTGLSATAVSLSSSESSFASYNSNTGVLSLGIPQGAKGEKGDAFVVNTQGTLANRSNYDNEQEGFAYNSTDTGEIYFKLSATAGDWSIGAPFGKGDKGDQGESVNIRLGAGNVLEWQYPSEGATWHALVDFDTIYDGVYLPTGGTAYNSSRLAGILAGEYYHTGNKPTASEVGAVPTSSVENTLNSTSITRVLSAAQGKALKSLVDDKFDKTGGSIDGDIYLESGAAELRNLSFRENGSSLWRVTKGTDGSLSLYRYPSNTKVFSIPKDSNEVTFYGNIKGISPVDNADLTTKEYVDGVISSLVDANTWRPVVDNLTSASTTESLSAAQGKVLKTLVDDKFDKTGGAIDGEIILNKNDGLSRSIYFRNEGVNSWRIVNTTTDGFSIFRYPANSPVMLIPFNSDTVTFSGNVRGVAPVVDTDFTNKKYVNDQINANGWRPVENTLTSGSTVNSLSAAQGKALKGLIDEMDFSKSTDIRLIKKILASDPQEGDYFGVSIAVSHDRIVIGAPEEDTGAAGAGAAYIYDNRGNFIKKITSGIALAGSNFGYSVAVSGDRIVVGAPNHGYHTSAWLFDADGNIITELFDQSIEAASKQGFSVAVSVDNVIVGAIANNSDMGIVTVYDSNGSIKYHLNASDQATLSNFGNSVAVSGDRIVVGAYNADVGGTNAGAAYVYDVSGIFITKLDVDMPNTNDNLGISVDVSGDRIVVGAYGEDGTATDAGAAYIYDIDGVLIQRVEIYDASAGDFFGNSIAISGNRVVIGAYKKDVGAGAAYVYNKEGVFVEKITASDAQSNDNFARSVAISGDVIAVGSYRQDAAATDAGAAYLYKGVSNNLIDCMRSQLGVD